MARFSVPLRNTNLKHVKAAQVTFIQTSPVTLFSAGSPSDTTISLSWVASPTSGATTKLYRSTTSGSGFTLIATKSAGVITHGDTGLDPDTTYYYYAVAYTVAGGDSDPSAEDSATTAEEGSQVVVQFPEHFTFRGSFALNRSGGGAETFYGTCLSLRNEPSDTGNTKHLLSTAGGEGQKFGVYEFRIPTPTIGTGFDPGQYTVVDPIKNYARQPYTDSEDVEHFMDNNLDGSNSIRWYPAEDKILFAENTGYFNQDAFGYATLNYAAGTAVAERWKMQLNNQGGKAISACFLILPPGLAALFDGEDLAMGIGGYFSIVAQRDVSMGNSLTIVPKSFIGSASESTHTGIPLFGYWPTIEAPSTGYGRSDRPEPETAVINTAWGLNKWDWNDRGDAACVIWTANKRGFLCFGAYGRGHTQYLESQIPSAYYGHYKAVFDPLDSTPLSSIPRHEVQPYYIGNVQFPVIDYSDSQYNQAAVTKAITSITSVMTGVTQITSNAAKNRGTTDGCTVTCPNHGLEATKFVRISGSPVSEYNGDWTVGSVIDANNFCIQTPGSSTMWSGTTTNSGGISLVRTCNVSNGCIVHCPDHGYVTSQGIGIVDSDETFNNQLWKVNVIDDDHFYIWNSSNSDWWPGTTSDNVETYAYPLASTQAEKIIGCDFDHETNMLYIMVAKVWGVNNLSGRPVCMVYELNNP